MLILTKGVLILTALFILTQSASAGGAWTRKPNSYYAKLGFTTLSSEKFFTIDGQSIQTSKFSTQSVSLYAEYGLPLESIHINRLDLIINFPFLRQAAFETSESASSIGDLMLELKYGLIEGDFPIALSIAAELPTGDQNAFGRIKNTSDSFIRLPLGDGEFNLWTKVFASHSFYPFPVFVSLDAGYNFRTQGFTDQYQFGIEAGYQAIEQVWIVGKFRRFATAGKSKADLFSGLGLGEGVEYNAVSVEASYKVLHHLWLSLEYASALGGLKNIYSGANITFGVAVEF